MNSTIIGFVAKEGTIVKDNFDNEVLEGLVLVVKTKKKDDFVQTFIKLNVNYKAKEYSKILKKNKHLIVFGKIVVANNEDSENYLLCLADDIIVLENRVRNSIKVNGVVNLIKDAESYRDDNFDVLKFYCTKNEKTTNAEYSSFFNCSKFYKYDEEKNISANTAQYFERGMLLEVRGTLIENTYVRDDFTKGRNYIINVDEYSFIKATEKCTKVKEDAEDKKPQKNCSFEDVDMDECPF